MKNMSTDMPQVEAIKDGISQGPVGSFREGQEYQVTQDILNSQQGSPLYGESFTSKRQQMADVHVLHEPEILNTMRYAMSVYERELEDKGYTPLTINSYISATNRFIEFLEIGQVIPDFDNKPQHH